MNHCIALRRAWTGWFPTAKGEVERRIDLPTHLLDDWETFTLERAFRQPPIDPARERLSVRLECVPGLVALSLDGHDLSLALSTHPIELPLEVSPTRRHQLTLHIDRRSDNLASDRADWGYVWVVVSDAESRGRV